MPSSRKLPNVLRGEPEDETHPVSRLELFFDLVFVFAATQLSHALLDDLTLLGGVHVLILLLAVWWVWIHTTWMTNILDPETAPVRIMLIVLMGIGLVLSSTIPYAFAERGLAFAACYVAIQLGRTAFTWWWLRGHEASEARHFQRILARLILSAPFWLAGGLADGEARLILWVIALVIDVTAPATGFRVPGLGRSELNDVTVEGGHMAERAGLFIIIALGESVLITGTTFAELPQTPLLVAALASAFISSVAMWWVYFQTGSDWASQSIQAAESPGRMARSAYTYLHIPIVAGIIVTAVADEFVLDHPGDPADLDTVLVSVLGPALFIGGTMAFKWAATHRFARSHLLGLAVLAALIPASLVLSTLAVSIVSTLAVVVTGVGEGFVTRAADDEELLA